MGRITCMKRLTNDKKFAAVMRNSELTMGARLLYWELHQWISDDLNICFPTQVKLSANLGVHRNSVIRWLQELREAGLVADVPRRYGNAYALLPGPDSE